MWATAYVCAQTLIVLKNTRSPTGLVKWCTCLRTHKQEKRCSIADTSGVGGILPCSTQCLDTMLLMPMANDTSPCSLLLRMSCTSWNSTNRETLLMETAGVEELFLVNDCINNPLGSILRKCLIPYVAPDSDSNGSPSNGYHFYRLWYDPATAVFEEATVRILGLFVSEALLFSLSAIVLMLGLWLIKHLSRI